MAPGEAAIAWSFAKKWDGEFSNDKIPGDTPYVDELKRFTPTREGVQLFLEAYGEDGTSFELEAVIKYSQNALVSEIREQGKPGSAWMDDRTFASYHQNSIFALVATSDTITAASIPEESPVGGDISCAPSVENVSHASEHTVSPGVMSVSSASQRATSNRYLPDSRRYPAPLTAELLLENLRKKVTIPLPKQVRAD